MKTMESFEKPSNNQTRNSDETQGRESLLPPELQVRLNELRKAQIDRDLTEDERVEFLNLQKMEEEAKKGITITEEETAELKDLRIAQIDGKKADGTDFSAEDSNRLIDLQNKEKGKGFKKDTPEENGDQMVA